MPHQGVLPDKETKLYLAAWTTQPFSAPWQPSAWDASAMTGFAPGPGGQLSVDGAANVSTVQASGGTVGVYETSTDAPDAKALMITMGYALRTEHGVRPWTATGGTLHFRFELQVPTATTTGVSATRFGDGSRAYIVWQNRFVDTTHLPTEAVVGSGTEIGFGARVFHLGGAPVDSVSNDPNSKRFFADAALVPGGVWLTLDADSAQFQSEPWTGFKQFGYTVSREQFAAVLAAIHAADPTLPMSLLPEDWALIQTYPNDEIDYQGGPAAMGWSLTGTSVTVEP
jgi:hypothetical protein